MHLINDRIDSIHIHHYQVKTMRVHHLRIMNHMRIHLCLCWLIIRYLSSLIMQRSLLSYHCYLGMKSMTNAFSEDSLSAKTGVNQTTESGWVPNSCAMSFSSFRTSRNIGVGILDQTAKKVLADDFGLIFYREISIKILCQPVVWKKLLE